MPLTSPTLTGAAAAAAAAAAPFVGPCIAAAAAAAVDGAWAVSLVCAVFFLYAANETVPAALLAWLKDACGRSSWGTAASDTESASH